MNSILWVRSRNCGCLVTWFCYQLIAKQGNKAATVSWPDPYACVSFTQVIISVADIPLLIWQQDICKHHMGQVMKVWLSCYLVLLSFDSKPGNKTATRSWPDRYPWWRVSFKIIYITNASALKANFENIVTSSFNLSNFYGVLYLKQLMAWCQIAVKLASSLQLNCLSPGWRVWPI